MNLECLIGTQHAECPLVPVRRDHQVSRRVRIPVQQHEGSLAAVDDETRLVVGIGGATEDAAVLLVRALDVLQAPRGPESLQNQPRTRKRISRPTTVRSSRPMPRSTNACQLATSPTIQPKFWPKKPVMNESGRKIVAITVSCFVVTLRRFDAVER